VDFISSIIFIYCEGLAHIHIKGTIVSLRNILLTDCCVDIQIVTIQHISKCLIIYLLRFS